ncbi:MAG: HAD-IA family hydrolase [Clostridiales Family XIII bacterium]|jgi:pyrophosphatase PpaX|nr:HAD-IA family hydrolase [Clostridiales Family XIII bacterium]
MKKIDTVLFDFDGTIMDTNELILRSWQHAFVMFTGKEGDEEEILRSYGEPIFGTVDRFFPDGPSAGVVAAYREYQERYYEETITLFPGILDLFKTLKTQGYAIGIVTSRLYHSAKIGLEKFGLFDYVTAFVTIRDTEKPKPDPEPILLALSQLEKKPEQAIMVGDTKHDIQCARNAYVVPVLVDWSLAVPPEARSGEDAPDYIIEKAEDLLGILEELNAYPIVPKPQGE